MNHSIDSAPAGFTKTRSHVEVARYGGGASIASRRFKYVPPSTPKREIDRQLLRGAGELSINAADLHRDSRLIAALVRVLSCCWCRWW